MLLFSLVPDLFAPSFQLQYCYCQAKHDKFHELAREQKQTGTRLDHICITKKVMCIKLYIEPKTAVIWKGFMVTIQNLFNAKLN